MLQRTVSRFCVLAIAAVLLSQVCESTIPLSSAPTTQNQIASALTVCSRPHSQSLHREKTAFLGGETQKLHGNNIQLSRSVDPQGTPLSTADAAKSGLFTSLTSSQASADTDCRTRLLASPLRLIIAGAPCTGKGTQCQHLREKLGIFHISTGDLLREVAKEDTETGVLVNKLLHKGQLVPDEIIESIVLERLNRDEYKQKGWLLDGFPRTNSQIEAFEKANIHPSHVFLLEAPDDLLVQRSINRRVDPLTGTIYNLITTLPPNPEVAMRLIQRYDDTEEVIRDRIEKYAELKQLILEHYKEKTIVLDGSVHAAITFNEILDILNPPHSWLSRVYFNRRIRNNVIVSFTIFAASILVALKNRPLSPVNMSLLNLYKASGSVVKFYFGMMCENQIVKRLIQKTNLHNLLRHLNTNLLKMKATRFARVLPATLRALNRHKRGTKEYKSVEWTM